MTLKIQMFGEMQVWRGDLPLQFRTRKELALLTYLLSESAPQSREHLCALLWPDQPRDRARNSLRVALAHLREQFPGELVATRATLAFVPAAEQQTDVAAFEAALGQGDTDAARALYRAPFMATLRLRETPQFGQWLDRRRRHFQALAESLHVAQDAVPGTPPTDQTLADQTLLDQPLVGRALDVRAVGQALERHRLVTVSGLIGCGKSALAHELVREWPLRQPGCAVLRAVLDPDSPEPWWRQLSPAPGWASLAEGAAQIGQSRVLLLLDDADALPPDGQDLGELLGRCGGLRILLTRRRPLHLRAEQVYLLAPLACPDTEALERADPAQLLAFPAVALLVRLLQRHVPNPWPDHAPAHALAQSFDLPILGAVCSALSGLPLALELAAAQSLALDPAQLLEMIRQPFEVLQAVQGDAPPRHYSLNGALAVAVGDLSASQRRTLGDLSVFSGGFQIEDAALLLDQSALPGQSALPSQSAALNATLRVLVESGLVQLRRSRAQTRFELPGLVRSYGRRQWSEPHAAALRLQHARVVWQAAERLVPADVVTFSVPAALPKLGDDVQAALRWCEQQELPEARELGLKLATRLAWSWILQGRAVDGQRWLRLLWPGEKATLPQHLARALLDVSVDAQQQAGLRRTLELARAQDSPVAQRCAWLSALALALVSPAAQGPEWLELLGSLPELPGPLCTVWWPRVRGVVLARCGQLAQAEEALSQAYQALGQQALSQKGLRGADAAGRALLATDVWQVKGEQRSVASLQERLSDLRAGGDQDDLAPSLLALASRQLAQGQLDEPLRLIGEQCRVWEDLNLLWGVAESVALFARVAFDEGEDIAAFTLYGAASALCQVTGPLSWPALWTLSQCLAELRTPVRTGAQRRAWQAGLTLSRGACLALMHDLRLRLRAKRRADAAV